jgi:hypothetical protein
MSHSRSDIAGLAWLKRRCFGLVLNARRWSGALAVRRPPFDFNELFRTPAGIPGLAGLELLCLITSVISHPDGARSRKRKPFRLRLEMIDSPPQP